MNARSPARTADVSPKPTHRRIPIAVENIGRTGFDGQARAYLEDVALPPFSEWRLIGCTMEGEQRVILSSRQKATLVSPLLHLGKGKSHLIVVRGQAHTKLRGRLRFVAQYSGVELAHRELLASGEKSWVLLLRSPPHAVGRLVLTLTRIEGPAFEQLSAVAFSLPALAAGSNRGQDTILPHWSLWQRAVHRLCKRSQFWNTIIADIEMHLGQDEVLSLPQYMALCPTGQCNASCGFCSVTINRTGIVKRQLPFDALTSWVTSVGGTIRQFGIEGNGEPSLYDDFDHLLALLSAGEATNYLITNAERLSRRHIELLLAGATDSINVSLNAATAQTHRRVMRFKGFERVVENIRRLVAWRGDAKQPTISVSFVVTRDNAHEAQDFLRFAEWDLKVDRILLRPLSELGTDRSVTEDLRALVPYESDLIDMVDAVADYLCSTPRRAKIEIDPTTFRSFRPDPPGAVVQVPGFEGRLLAPRRDGWRCVHADARLDWHLNEFVLTSRADSKGAVVAQCDEIPVEPGSRVQFRCMVAVTQGVLGVSVEDANGRTMANTQVCASPEEEEIVLDFPTADAASVKIRLLAKTGATHARLRFERLRTSGPPTPSGFRLPHPHRWQIDSDDVFVEWRGTSLLLRGSAPVSHYLASSYFVPCEQHVLIEIPVDIEVHAGVLGIGVLSEDGSQWTQQYRFERGESSHTLLIQTRGNRKLKLVLYALSEDPLKAEIDWGDALDPQPVFKERPLPLGRLWLPTTSQWVFPRPGVESVSGAAEMRLLGDVTRGLCLARSGPITCVHLRGVTQDIALELTVSKGRIGLWFFSRTLHWPENCFEFGPGEHHPTLQINSLDGDELEMFVVALEDGAIEARLAWPQSLLATPPEWTKSTLPPIEKEIAALQERGYSLQQIAELLSSDGLEIATPTLERARADALAQELPQALTTSVLHPEWRILRLAWAAYGRLGFTGFAMRMAGKLRNRAAAALIYRVARRRPSIYCQKPWTDLHNFSVDGRMDVCCIATGESQQRFALGNMFSDSFQAIWNGKAMREFRRTVNTDRKLPPCARCPMANNYSPPRLT